MSPGGVWTFLGLPRGRASWLAPTPVAGEWEVLVPAWSRAQRMALPFLPWLAGLLHSCLAGTAPLLGGGQGSPPTLRAGACRGPQPCSPGCFATLCTPLMPPVLGMGALTAAQLVPGVATSDFSSSTECVPRRGLRGTVPWTSSRGCTQWGPNLHVQSEGDLSCCLHFSPAKGHEWQIFRVFKEHEG